MGSTEESVEEVTRAARWQNVFLRSRKGTLIMVSWELITRKSAGLSTGAAFLQGMNPSVFVVYRQAIATLFIAPIAYFSRKNQISVLWDGAFSNVFGLFVGNVLGFFINGKRDGKSCTSNHIRNRLYFWEP